MLAESYGQRPSALLSIEDGWLAYQVDLAVLALGREVERMTAPDEKGKVRMSVTEALRRLSGEEPGRERYQNPQSLLARGVAIRER